MRVTMVNKYYPPHLGGIEHHLRDLSVALAARPGVHVRALVSNEGRGKVLETLDGVDVVRLSRAFAYASTPVALGMPAAIRRQAAGAEPADLLHLHSPYPWGETSWQMARAGLPTVLSYHSDIVRQKALLAVYGPLLRRLLDRVDLIIAASPDMVEHSEFLAPVASKCRVVPYGIDVGSFATPEVLERAARLRDDRRRPVVLFAGRLVYYKGVDILVRAMADVDADLVLLGRGPLESELRAAAERLGIADRVTFLPPQPDGELRAWYAAADVLCLPSVARSEAFGIVQIEAHAAGTPVVSTALPTGVPFANKDGETGIVVPVGDAGALAEALRAIVGDAGLRERLGRGAQARAREMFGTERMVEGVLSVYREARGEAA
ncbi:MAG: glycosyltransferase [Coriobacteriia bacterium]